MTLNPISALQPLLNATSSSAATQPTTGGNFAQFLASAVDQANQLSNVADTAAATYAAGGPVTLSDLMIAEQKASLALDTVVQVRNRVVSAYQSVMNMQI